MEETKKIYEGMSLVERLGNARVEFGNLELKKSGYNGFAKFNYFELKDFEKKADDVLNKWGIGTIGPTFKMDEGNNEWSILNVFSYDTQESYTQILPSSAHPKIQDVGALVTYYQRYHFQTLLHLTEDDPTDATIGKTKEKETNYATSAQVKMITDNKEKLMGLLKEKNIKSVTDIKSLTMEEADSIIQTL